MVVKLTTHLVQAYYDGELIKAHPRVAKWQRPTDWDDFPPDKVAFFRCTPDWCRHQAEAIGDEVKKTVPILLDDHALYHLHQVHGIIRLKDKCGKERLNATCARANAFGDPAYRTIKNILEKGMDQDDHHETEHQINKVREQLGKLQNKRRQYSRQQAEGIITDEELLEVADYWRGLW